MGDDIPREPIHFRFLVYISSSLVAGTGFIALLGWGLQLPFLTGFGPGRIPMAPSTALLFVLYGIAFFLRPGLTRSRGAYWVGIVSVAVGTLVAFLMFFLSILGIHPAFEHIGFPIRGMVGGAQIGHMSPVAALCFLLAGLSFFLLPPSVTDRSWRAKVALCSASLLVASSLVLLLAYLFGTPLFYTGSFIPPALNTSIAFLVLGIALLCLALPHTRFLRREEEQVTRTEYVLLLVFLLLAAGIVTVGYLYHMNYERRYRNEAESQLSAIAELKVRELEQYRKERLSDAAVFFRNASFADMVRRFLEQPGDVGARQQLLAWIGNYGAQFESGRVFLLDTRGNARISVPETPRPADSTISRRASEIARSGQMAFQDFYRNEINRKIFLAVLIPILDEQEGGRPLGVLVLRMDPENYLYPLINHWPTPSRTAETLLVRRDGNDALVLNELKIEKNAALTLRVPLDPNSESPVVKAVLGKKGIVEGWDVRGKPVLADVREVPDSPWFVVARMDLSEIYEPARERLWWMVSMVCVMLLAAGTGLGLAWRQQRARFYRKRYEAEREHAWLQDVISRSLNEIYVFDPTTLRFKFVNSGGLRNLGYTMEELASMTPIDIKPEYTEEAFRAMTQPLVSGEREVLVFETVHRRKDGSDYPAEAHLQLISTAGAVVFLAIVTDITDRRQSERALRESEEKFRVIFEGSKDGIILTDVESKKFHTGNKAFCDMLQYTLDEIRQLGVSDIHPEEYLHRILDAFGRGVKRESEVAGEIPIRRKDGSVWWADVTANPVTISGKKYLLGNFRDVTERRKTGETLARLGMAVEQSAETIVITDREGTIQYVNPEFECTTGYSVEEVIGKNSRILRSGKHDDSFYREMWGALLRGEIWEGHFINRKKDGSLYEEDATISPVRDASGNFISFVAVKRDVTRLLSLEKQVRMAQKMEAVGTLAGGIAHDFNNALTGIIGFGELLRMRMAGDGPALHDLDEILRCAERAATLTRQLLTFARRQIIEPVKLNLSALIADLMRLIGKVVGEHIEVNTSLEKDVPTIHADRGQIEQVVMNLCLNARDAMPEGGRLVVKIGGVYLDEEYVRQNPYMKKGRYALVTVSDTGIGMDEKTRERVFEPFFTTKGPDKGTGLGLAMVYGIVKQHGGFIHLYSEPGKGTEFKVYFPAIEAQPDVLTEKRMEEIVHGGMETILLAEDEEAIRSFIERTLKELGYTVLVARNGEEAIEMFRRNNEIALAVLDAVMPRKGGKEAFEEMHKENPRLKVLFMSGYSANAIHDSFVLVAGTPFLQKPFGPTTLARKIRELLDTQ